jgi:hypothetical protein
MTNMVEFAQALSSKLCHEFAGTIGAINNCISLINTKDEAISLAAVELLKENTKTLVNKLKLYRCAYSLAEEEGIIRHSEIIELSNQFLGSDTRKIKFDYTYTFIKSNSLPINIGKLLLSLIIEAYNDFIKEGVIKVTLYEDANNHYSKICLKVTSKWLKIDRHKSSMLSDHNIKHLLTVYNVHEYYISILAKQLNYQISIDISSVKNNVIEYILETI